MDRYYPVSLTVPAGTAIATPVSQAVPLENNYLVDIEIEIPSGHSGFTGLRVLSSSQQVLPWGNSSWIVADGYNRVFPWNEEVGSKAISVQGYNTDTIAHTFYLRFHIVNLPVITPTTGSTGESAGSTPIGLSGGGDTGTPITIPTLPPITIPTLPVPPVISPISGVPQPAASPYNARQERMFLLNG